MRPPSPPPPPPPPFRAGIVPVPLAPQPGPPIVGPPAASDARLTDPDWYRKQQRLALEAGLLAKLKAEHLAKAKTSTEEWLDYNPLVGPDDANVPATAPQPASANVPAAAAARAPTAALRARSVPGGSSNDPFRHFQVSGVRRPGCPEGWHPEAFGVPRGAGLTHRDAIGHTDAYRVPPLTKTSLCSFHLQGVCRRGRQQHKRRWPAVAAAAAADTAVG